jgi:hypothetical protein
MLYSTGYTLRGTPPAYACMTMLMVLFLVVTQSNILGRFDIIFDLEMVKKGEKHVR